MERKEIAVRSTDVGRVLEKFDSSILGNSFRATLPTSKIVRLLISLQGMDIIKMPALESIAYSEFQINPFELKKTYLPQFQEWGFVRVYDDKIEETITEREKVLNTAGKFWEESDPNKVEQLSIDLFDLTAKAPRPVDQVEKLLANYDNPTIQNATFHLNQSQLTNTFDYKDTKWYYSPEIFGENYEKSIKFMASLTEPNKTQVYSVIDKVCKEEGIPHDVLSGNVATSQLDIITGAGLLMGYPLTLNGNTQTFYFTPGLRNRFDKLGRGDKFEIIKTGISHFEYAYYLANPGTGQLSYNPTKLLDRLLENGRAGNATAIGTDYEALIKKGLIKIQPTFGSRFEFILPDSKEKIADLEAIRDAFSSRTILPQTEISLENMGIKGEVTTGDSLVYRSRRAIQAKELTKQLVSEMYKL